jgi:hypothetical protein
MFSLKKSNLFILLATICTLLCAPLALAKPINLYQDPKPDAKVVTTIDSTAKMVPIITSKEGDWMKVGDPKNGNVGWVKVSDVETGGGSFTGFTITQHTVSTSKGPRTIQTIQFSEPQVMSPAESDAMVKQMQQRQEELQKSIQKVMNEFYKGMNNLFNNNKNLFDDTSSPSLQSPTLLPADTTPPKSAVPPVKNP